MIRRAAVLAAFLSCHAGPSPVPAYSTATIVGPTSTVLVAAGNLDSAVPARWFVPGDPALLLLDANRAVRLYPPTPRTLRVLEGASDDYRSLPSALYRVTP